MKIRLNYFLIPIVTVLVAVVGSIFSTSGMLWYKTTLIRPDFTPPNIAFPIAWTTIFILTSISALLIWNSSKKAQNFNWIAGLFIANAVLNVLWSLLFFNLHLLGWAFLEMFFLEATVIALIILIWKPSKLASIFLLPYALWVGFATYLTYLITLLN